MAQPSQLGMQQWRRHADRIHIGLNGLMYGPPRRLRRLGNLGLPCRAHDIFSTS
jgi:hypothetical protein